MILSEIRAGHTIFIDTNVLIYARTNRSIECRQLLARCQARDVNGVISGFVVAEFCHRRMMQEAQSFGRLSSNPARVLGQKPDIVRKLSVYADDVRALLNGELSLINTEEADFAVALEFQNPRSKAWARRRYPRPRTRRRRRSTRLPISTVRPNIAAT
jgi:predicted nucleic acid-binding protein